MALNTQTTVGAYLATRLEQIGLRHYFAVPGDYNLVLLDELLKNEALQMISWGLEVNDYGNAFLDANGNFVKVPEQGLTETLWAEMVAYAQARSLKAGDYKKLNLPFENKLLGLPREVRARMARRVEDFAYHMMVKVFNAEDTAPLAIEAILKTGSYSPRPKARRIEKAADWTPEKIKEKAAGLQPDKGPQGNFDD